MAEYLMILSQGIVHFCKHSFTVPFQPELLIDKVDSLLPFLFSIAALCFFHSLAMSSLDIFENKHELLVEARAFATAPLINNAILAILDVDVFQ